MAGELEEALRKVERERDEARAEAERLSAEVDRLHGRLGAATAEIDRVRTEERNAAESARKSLEKRLMEAEDRVRVHEDERLARQRRADAPTVERGWMQRLLDRMTQRWLPGLAVPPVAWIYMGFLVALAVFLYRVWFQGRAEHYPAEISQWIVYFDNIHLFDAIVDSVTIFGSITIASYTIKNVANIFQAAANAQSAESGLPPIADSWHARTIQNLLDHNTVLQRDIAEMQATNVKLTAQRDDAAKEKQKAVMELAQMQSFLKNAHELMIKARALADKATAHTKELADLREALGKMAGGPPPPYPLDKV